MTFENTALAINGSRLNGSLIRRGMHASTNGTFGVGQVGDLKVSALDVPGQGIKIGAGVGLVVNDYQTVPNETYVVSNPEEHVVPSALMPGASGSARRYLVCVVVGDPDFSQAGHPWMGADDPAPGTEQTFEYVRVTLIQVASGAKTLSGNYPALVLAALDIPANTTTITNAMLTDLTKLAQPRSSQDIATSPAGTWTNGSPLKMPANGWANWGSWTKSVEIPSWARRAIIVAKVNGIVVKDNSVNIYGQVRAKLGTATSAPAVLDMETDGGNGWERVSLEVGHEFDVTSLRGTTQTLRMEASQTQPGSPTANQKPELRGGSQMVFDVRFFEQ